MLFDTHCHLNFKSFKEIESDVITRAHENGVNTIVVPGTDVPTSEKAVEIAQKYEAAYAAVGIHPHHVFEIFKKSSETQFLSHESLTSALRGPLESEKIEFSSDINKIEKILLSDKVIAVGEVGIDRHIYEKTKYKDYKIDERFVDLQKEFLIAQIKLAYQYKKSLILHNREAKDDILEILTNHQSLIANYSSVFHCCEPDLELLEFAKNNKMFIGVDGDITYRKDKQDFVKKIPKEMLVLETDSPFLSPFRKFPNEPKNIKVINEFIAGIIGESPEKLAEITTENAKRLFKISNY